MMSLGYLKDMISAVMFLIVLMIITVRQKTLPLHILQVGMVAALLFDGSFTVFPRLHNAPLNDPKMGFVTYLLLLFLISFISVIIYMLYKGD